jgi:hypothetical protein
MQTECVSMRVWDMLAVVDSANMRINPRGLGADYPVRFCGNGVFDKIYS